ncbi:MAG: cytochrome P450 [Anaerolineales bacterium]
MPKNLKMPPVPQGKTGLTALNALLKERHLLGPLSALHRAMGDIFQVPLPSFDPVVMIGPEANRFVLVGERNGLKWRNDKDPVVDLLHHGVLVIDGDDHDWVRKQINPSLHKKMIADYIDIMVSSTDEVISNWKIDRPLNMLDEMRKIALLILMRSVFGIDFKDRMEDLWDPILKCIAFISPGLWVLTPKFPRLGYRGAREKLDTYLFEIIRQRRVESQKGGDLLSYFVNKTDMSDELIRDQLLTLLIAGHDTSTASLAWTLYLLGENSVWMERVVDEVDTIIRQERPGFTYLKSLDVLNRVSKEALRLYPPIHLGSRVAAKDLQFGEYLIPEGQRVVYSIYLSHRHPAYWRSPNKFDPDRFLPEKVKQRPHYVYLPFGGGPRNCIGFSFAKAELPIVLARILQRFSLQLEPTKVHMHMGATLEPRPGVFMTAQSRVGS